MTNMGVTIFDSHAAKTAAAENFICLVYGGPKTGKTHFATHCDRPLYLVYLDRNPGWRQHLIKTEAEYPGEVYPLVIAPPRHYSDLTQEGALAIIQQIDTFAEKAVANAKERAAKGLNGGTFVVDGATFLKGYIEKALLGQSTTLGGRPAKGERGWPTTYAYAKSNAALVEFIGSFLGSTLDACFVFEGRPVYKKVWRDGEEANEKTDAWRTTRPDNIPYAVNAEVETLKTLDRVNPSDNTSMLVTRPKIRVAFNSEDFKFDNMVLPALTFKQFKMMLLVPTLGAEALKGAQPANTVLRASPSGLPGNEVEE